MIREEDKRMHTICAKGKNHYTNIFVMWIIIQVSWFELVHCTETSRDKAIV